MWKCARASLESSTRHMSVTNDTNRPEGKDKLKPAGETPGILGGARFCLRECVCSCMHACLCMNRYSPPPLPLIAVQTEWKSSICAGRVMNEIAWFDATQVCLCMYARIRYARTPDEWREDGRQCAHRLLYVALPLAVPSYCRRRCG